MKSLLSWIPISELSLPAVTILAIAVILFPASQFAVLGLLRATQPTHLSSIARLPAAVDQEAARPTTGWGSSANDSSPATSSPDPLLVMASALQRERRVAERLPSTASPASTPSSRGAPPKTSQERLQAQDAAFSGAPSTVAAPRPSATGSAERVQSAAPTQVAEPLAIEFAALPLDPTSDLAPPFVLTAETANGRAWSLVHPDLLPHASSSPLRVTLSRTLGH